MAVLSLLLTLSCSLHGGASADSDGDGLSDAREAELGTRPDLRDTDGDGQSDRDEVERWHTDPLRKDTDGDGAPDGFEISTRKTDPRVADPPSDPGSRPPDRVGHATDARRRGA
ncbi:MAG TPA: hypothetical protein PKA64_19945, partial [Myxococcota bacterium]|nr:hypothetical protein [Myxococcota bacterium]